MKTITLRRLEPGDTTTPGDYYAKKWDEEAYRRYREVSPIPEGYEVCDLEDATKVLIGETWCDVERDGGGSWIMVLPNKTYHMHGFSSLGLLAIRPIPEPVQPPLTGEVRVGVANLFGVESNEFGLVCFAPGLIGKRIRWEVVKDGGE